MNKQDPEFHSGIEPGGPTRFFQNWVSKNWTTILLTKQLFLLKWTRLCLICSTPSILLFSFVLFVCCFTGYDLVGLTCLGFGHLSRNWTCRPWPKYISDSILELNLVAVMFFSGNFYSGIEPFFYSQNSTFRSFWGHIDTPLPNIHLPQPPLPFLFVSSYLPYGIKPYKRGSSLFLEVMWHLRNNPKVWPQT